MDKKNDELCETCKYVGDEEHHVEPRRRGEILEDAILKAAWDELLKVGYSHMTMDGVAARAKTNKSVMYRRWSSKSKLVLAVLHKHVINPEGIPNTGDLRNDVLILLMGIAKPLQTIGAETLHGLMIEHISEDSIHLIPQIMNLEETMIAILKNAELRGEVNLKKISPQIVSLPMDLVRYKILTTPGHISDKTINEIIDDIFLPLVRL